MNFPKLELIYTRVVPVIKSWTFVITRDFVSKAHR